MFVELFGQYKKVDKITKKYKKIKKIKITKKYRNNFDFSILFLDGLVWAAVFFAARTFTKPSFHAEWLHPPLKWGTVAPNEGVYQAQPL